MGRVEEGERRRLVGGKGPGGLRKEGVRGIVGGGI